MNGYKPNWPNILSLLALLIMVGAVWYAIIAVAIDLYKLVRQIFG